MNRRITMADVAREAGVHQTTVSLALRNDPRLPVATRERIAALAKALGYRPNPMVSALVSERRRRGNARQGSVLAFLTNSDKRDYWRASQTYVGLHDRMEVHAHDLGYRLEEFWLREPGMTPARMRSILLHRGIRGIVICPLSGVENRIEFDFSEFAAIALGYTLRSPELDHVSTDYAANIGLAIHQLLAQGYRRILFTTTMKVDQRVNHFSLGRYLAERHRRPRSLLAPLIIEEKEAPSLRLLERRPEAIIVATGDEFSRVETLLRSAGIRVPEGIALINLDRRKDERESGITRLIDEEAHATIALVTSRVERARFGVPASPQSILIPGRWAQGWSTTAATPAPPTA